MTIELLAKEQVYSGYAKVERWQIRHHGQNRQVECVQRGHSVALLPFDPVSCELLLVSQFRPGAFPEHQEFIELIAGMIDDGETPAEAAVREAHEETGLQVRPEALTHLGRFYLSPGIMTETTDIFLCRADLNAIDYSQFGGLAAEGEAIRKLRMSYGQLRDHLAQPGGHSVTLALAFARLAR